MERIGQASKWQPSRRDSSSPAKSSLDEARVQALGSIITRARLVTNLPPLEPDSFVAALAAWEEIIHEIPTTELDECYRRAMHAHNPKHPFGVSELWQAWQQIWEERKYARQFPLVTAPKQIESGRITLADYRQETGWNPSAAEAKLLDAAIEGSEEQDRVAQVSVKSPV